MLCDIMMCSVPLVSYRSRIEMGGRVAFSMLSTLGVEELAVMVILYIIQPPLSLSIFISLMCFVE